MFIGHVIFFRQKAALNFPSQLPLKVKYTADNQRKKHVKSKLKSIIQILKLSDKIFFDF